MSTTLNREEMAVLAVEAGKGCPEARRLLIEENGGLVYNLVRRWAPPPVRTLHWDDACAVAKMAILKASETFNPAKGGWTTHATWVVRRHLHKMIQSHVQILKVARGGLVEKKLLASGELHAIEAGLSLDFAFEDGAPLLEAVDPAPLPGEELEELDGMELIPEAVASLPKHQRKAVEQFLATGSYNDKTKGTSRQAQGLHWQKALRTLRKNPKLKELAGR